MSQSRKCTDFRKSNVIDYRQCGDLNFPRGVKLFQ